MLSKRKSAAPTVGGTIRSARLGRDMSLRELARQTEVTPAFVSDIEHGTRLPSDEVVGKIAAILDLNAPRLVALADKVRVARLKDRIDERKERAS